MELSGGCHCGAVRYRVAGEPVHASVCHCSDCRSNAGAPFVAWAAFARDRFQLTKGEPRAFNGTGTAFRYFCGDCGTGLYYVNESILPGLVDIQIATLDDPEALPPRAQVQTAEKLDWVDGVSALPGFARYPGME